jgi:hypothetical protein
VVASLALNGPASLEDYLSNQLPRISRYGEYGPEDMKLPPAVLAGPLSAVPAGQSVMDGRPYREEAFALDYFATLVEPVRSWLHTVGCDLGLGAISALLAGLFLGAIGAWRAAVGRRQPLAESHESFAWWMICLTVILLAGPTTWVMNMVWLLLAGPWLIVAYGRLTTRREALALVGCALALLLAALPDAQACPLMLGGMRAVGHDQAWMAELLLLGSLLLWLTPEPRRRQDQIEAPAGLAGSVIS